MFKQNIKRKNMNIFKMFISAPYHVPLHSAYWFRTVKAIVRIGKCTLRSSTIHVIASKPSLHLLQIVKITILHLHKKPHYTYNVVKVYPVPQLNYDNLVSETDSGISPIELKIYLNFDLINGMQ